jgi:hypothetical protein
MNAERDRVTRFRTLGGAEVEVKTPYACAKPRGSGTRATRGAQGTGVYYVLDELGIAGRSTPALRLLVSHAVCEANSVTAARALLAGAGVEIDHKAALRLTYMTTDTALAARKAAVAATTEGNDAGPFVGLRVVASIDGGRVQIRRRVAGRPRKGGRKNFETEWREPKVLTIYVLDEAGRRDRRIPSVIDGTLGNADAVFELLLYHLRRLGAHRASELVLIGDGAEWLWNRAEGLRTDLGLPRAQFTEILDYFHVSERLHEFAQTRPWDEDHRARWYATQKAQLKEGNIEAIETVLRAIEKRYDLNLAPELAFWDRHRERLRYRRFRRRGLPVGSGAIESAVRRVINLRMKGASVVWTEDHAEGILHLRAHAKAGRWAELESAVLRNTGWRPSSRIVRAPQAA